MKLLSMELVGYKRLAANSNRIKRIKITPQSKIQLLLGTNGSGKSSLIKEMSPLPGLPAAFEKPGYKIVEYSHKNSHYVLKNYFNELGNRYHFIKDGVEQMKTNTSVTAFKELVATEFGITQDVHNLVTGLLKFTLMDSTKRRSWMTRFSDVDYTFALSYYGRLKDRLKGTQEALKLFQGRLVQESDKLLQPEEEKRYREDIRVLNECLTHFLESKSPVDRNYKDVVNDIHQIDGVLTRINREYITQRKNFYKEGIIFESTDDIDKRIIDVQANIQSYQHRINVLCETIEQQQRTLESLRSSNVTSFAEIDKTLDSIDNSIAEKKQAHFYPDFIWSDPASSLNTLNSIYDNLSRSLMELPVNEDMHYSRKAVEAAQEEIVKRKAESEGLVRRCIDIKAKLKELEHMKTHDKIECPECSHSWFRGFDQKLFDKLTSDLSTFQAADEDINKKIVLSEKYIESARDYFDKYRSFRSIMSATENQLSQMWEVVMKSDDIFKQPRLLVTVVDRIKQDLQLQVEIKELLTKQKEAFDLKILLSKNQNLNLLNVQEEVTKNDKILYQTNLELSRHQRTLTKLNSCKQAIKKMTELRAEMDKLLERRDVSTSKLDDLVRRDVLNEYIGITKQELAEREQVISRINIQKALVQDIEAQVKELTVKVEVIKMAVQELSPKEGLIAKGLTGFINHFIFQVNSFIKKAWLYPMEIVPIEILDSDNVELDYQFKISVNGEENAPDISVASSGMKEVIDLAFTIVSMQYLGLQHAPIFLDEFGARLDNAHRDSVHHLITNLLTTANFSQIFMVSHYENTYASLANTDITVLCDSNLGLTKDTIYNRNVEIE